MKDPTNIMYFMRRRLSLTQEEIAKTTKLTKNDISRMERGIFSHEMWKFMKLSEYFNISIEALLNNNIKAAFHTFKAAPDVSRKMMARLSALREKHNDIGCRGEDWIFQQELKRLNGTEYQYAVNPNFADDEEASFDILSFSHDGEIIIIEVKTTTGDAEDAFFFTANELEKAKKCIKNRDRYEIHRVHHIDEPSKSGRQIIPAEKLFKDYEFIPEVYKVVRKEKVKT